MGGVSNVRVSGPLASLADDLREGLEGRGYSPWTVVGYLRLMGHLSRWLADSGLGVLPLTTSEVNKYLQVRRAAGYRTFLTMGSVDPLLDYLHRRGQVVRAVDADDVEDPAHGLLGRYASYLQGERGLVDVTIERRVLLARRILSTWERS